jgi:hypothetical protein
MRKRPKACIPLLRRSTRPCASARPPPRTRGEKLVSNLGTADVGRPFRAILLWVRLPRAEALGYSLFALRAMRNVQIPLVREPGRFWVTLSNHMRALWKGAINFGLENIPVSLYPATRREELNFRLLGKSDLSPVTYKRVEESRWQGSALGPDCEWIRI